MKSLMIKDLQVAKALNSEELAAVRGGSITVFGAQVGSTLTQLNGGGVNSPAFAFQANPQNLVQSPTDVDITSVIGSLNTLVFKA